MILLNAVGACMVGGVSSCMRENSPAIAILLIYKSVCHKHVHRLAYRVVGYMGEVPSWPLLTRRGFLPVTRNKSGVNTHARAEKLTRKLRLLKIGGADIYKSNYYVIAGSLEYAALYIKLLRSQNMTYESTQQ